MDLLARYNVRVSGRPDGQPVLFSHGFGCDQNMWRYVAPAFEDSFRVVLFDHAGAGGVDPDAYDPVRHSSLDGYAEDVLALCHALELRDVVFVGHSVSSMIGVLADIAEPGLFAKLVFVSPSPRYINDEETGYTGGFTEADIRELLDSLDSNYLGWSSVMAPVIMGNGDRPELGQELLESFCRTDPAIARRFAEVTFTSDNRAELPLVQAPTLVLQCSPDVIAPVSVGEYVAEHVPDATLVMLRASGHCPNLSAPDETIAAIAPFLRDGALGSR
jgi:sigma-B regulation protein RsbQ